MSFVRRFVFATVAVSGLLASSQSFAETIFGALSKAYQFNSELNSARAGVRVTDENVAIAKSGYRPQIVSTNSYSYTSQSGVQISTGSFGVAISQTLFDGFQTKNNVRAAHAQVLASNEGLRNTEQNILFNAASAYMDVIRDRQIAALTERNVKSLAEQLRAARSRFDVGEGTRTDVAQADAARSAAVAQASAARAQVASSEAIYRQIVGENPGKLKATGPVKGLPKSIEAAYAQAAAEHPAIMANLHLVDASGFSVKSAEGALLPQLSAEAGVSTSNTGGYPAGNPNNGWNDRASFGATLRVPIYQGGRVSATVRQRKESLGQARIEVDVSRDQVRAAVASAWSQYQAAAEGVQANRDLVAAAQLALNGVVEERNVGQRTTLDVLNAQADVISAQINQVGTERNYVVASYAILSAIGRLSVGRLGLQVAQYKPEEHYNAVKDKWFGLRTPDGR
jgi:outer membrane protein